MLSLAILTTGYGVYFLSAGMGGTQVDSAKMIADTMTKVNDEIRIARENGDNSRVLSRELVGEIIDLSRSLPYDLNEKTGLPEKLPTLFRGQLLLELVKSDLNAATYDKIYSSATFRYANLKNADLSKANLKGVFLSRSALNGANLEDANLSGANLLKANLEDANLNGADISKANLRSANLSRAKLKGANMEDTYLIEATSVGTSLAGLTADLGRN